MDLEYALFANAYIEYDGTNSSDMLDVIQERWQDAFIASEDDGVLVLNSGEQINDPAHLTAGDRLSVVGWDTVSPADWATKYVKV